jgi:nucleoside-diphosphate-sugar epimerase
MSHANDLAFPGISARPRVLVTGAGGFIGHHLVNYLVAAGYRVRGVDLVLPAFASTRAHEFLLLDLRRADYCAAAVHGMDEVYHLAANMGGMGFIEFNKAQIAHDNVLMDANMLEAARHAGVKRFFYASSACVYPPSRLQHPDAPPLREEDAYPADPVDGYGWEKLYMERLCRHYREDFGLETRVARFHSMYGPLGTYDGGREKAPAAICRKAALADDGGTIDIWGDGEQTRTYCYIDDCVEGIHRLMRSGHHEPVNLGSDVLVTINELALLVARVAGKRVTLRHVNGPEGVRGRGSDNARMRAVLGWEPRVPLEEGMRRTYGWIAAQLQAPAAAVRHAIAPNVGSITGEPVAHPGH